MLARLFAIGSVLSLLTSLAAAAGWVRSYYASDQLVWTREDGSRSLRWFKGQVVVSINLGDYWEHRKAEYGMKYQRSESWPPSLELMNVLLLCYDRTARTVYWESSGFGWSQRRSSRDLIATAVAPFWSVTAATSMMPAGWMGLVIMRRAKQRRRKRLGLCAACGYDLRASESRCPECGAVAASK